jgi:hypothetical protein
MEFILAMYFSVLAVVIGAVVLLRVSRGEPLLSTLHFFFAGFIIFQLTSAALALGFQHYGEIPVADPAYAGTWYAVLVTIFLVIFAVGWKTKALTFGLQNKIGTKQPVPTSATMMALAWGILGTAAFFRFVLAFIPVFSALALIIAAALASAAVAIGAWAWARHWANPAFVALFAVLLVTTIAMVIYQNFGRRDVTSVLIAAAWGAFHGHFKTISFRRAFFPFVAISVFGMVTIAAFTSTRTEKIVQMSFQETFTRLFSANIVTGLVDMAAGQECAVYSMYLVEGRPEIEPYNHLHSLSYAATALVPRIVWENKPVPLGLTMVPELGITKKSEGYNVGPGLIGHILNDNPYICLWLYPLLLAAMLRIFDDLVKKFHDNPFIVVPVGVALGEITALARGELGLFLFRTVVAVISAYLLMWITARIMVGLGLRYQAVPGSNDQPTDDESADQLDEPTLVDPVAAQWYGQDDPSRDNR